MHTYGHINISEMPKYTSAATNMKLFSIKTIINHNINDEKRINIAAYVFESLFGPLRLQHT